MPNKFTTQAGTVYLKQADTFDAYQWGGSVMRIDEASDALGTGSPSYAQNPRGGVSRDGLLRDNPGLVTFGLAMKQTQGDQMKTQLKSCYWNVDRRTHCGGRERDDPNAWLEITRNYFSFATTRSTPESTWEGEDDAMVNVAMQALNQFDIYQVTLEEFTFGAGT